MLPLLPYSLTWKQLKGTACTKWEGIKGTNTRRKLGKHLRSVHHISFGNILPVYSFCFDLLNDIFCVLIYLMISFEYTTTHFKEVQIQFVSLFKVCTFDIIYLKIFTIPRSWWFYPSTPSGSFNILALTFRSMIHFELILCTVWRKCLNSYYCIWI